MNPRIAAAVVVALVVATAADVVVGAGQPGLIPAFTLVASVLLVLVPKWLARNGLQRAAGTRAGELGDMADAWDDSQDGSQDEEAVRG